MSQILLKSDNKADIDLLLAFARRLNIGVVEVNEAESLNLASEWKQKIKLMGKAADDPLFLSDIAEVLDDFK
jgi:putative cell wall-binding protein